MSTSYHMYGQSFVHPALLVTDGMKIGNVSFGYEDVASYDVSSVVERDWDGQLLCCALYGAASAMFLVEILIGSLDWKFAIAVVFLGSICFMSMCDALGTQNVTLYNLDITLVDGRRLRFVDTDPKVVNTLAGRIQRAAG